jgi:hypothetical protein
MCHCFWYWPHKLKPCCIRRMEQHDLRLVKTTIGIAIIVGMGAVLSHISMMAVASGDGSMMLPRLIGAGVAAAAPLLAQRDTSIRSLLPGFSPNSSYVAAGICALAAFVLPPVIAAAVWGVALGLYLAAQLPYHAEMKLRVRKTLLSVGPFLGAMLVAGAIGLVWRDAIAALMWMAVTGVFVLPSLRVGLYIQRKSAALS